MAKFIPKNSDELYVEVIFEAIHKDFSPKLVPTNRGYVRFLSENLSSDLVGKCVIFTDGFIVNLEREQFEILGRKYTRLNRKDVVAVLN